MTPARPSLYRVRDLAASLWLNRDPSRCWLAFFICYGDTSGVETDKEGAVVFAGLVATVRDWQKFESKWNAQLANYKVEALHMKNYGPIAKEWGEAKARGFEQGVVGVVGGHISIGVLSAVEPEDFRSVDKSFRLTEGFDNGPHGLAAWLGIYRVLNWMEREHPNDQIKFVIEHGDPGQGVMRDYCNKKGLPVEFIPKEMKVRPLEGADLIAWAMKRQYDERADGKRPAPRDISQMVSKRVPLLYGRQTAETLTAVCNEDPARFPAR